MQLLDDQIDRGKDMFDRDSIPGFRDLYSRSAGSADICVAVIDGDVDLDHECFRGADLQTIDPFGTGAIAGRALEHGTHVTSIIFGQRGSVVEGIASGCRGLVIPLFGSDADGQFKPATQVQLAQAISLAADRGAQIINISGGQRSISGVEETFLADTIRRCSNQGILIVAAAGNDGCDCQHIPASNPHILAVGAMRHDGTPLDFSNFGAVYRSNGILAPGEDILGARAGGGVWRKTGTSYATPIVSGVAALLLSMQIELGHTPDPRTVFRAIMRSSSPCDPKAESDCTRVLSGRLDVAAAMRAIEQPEGESHEGQKFHLLTNGVNMSEYNQQTEEVATMLAPDTADTNTAMIIPQEHDAAIVPSECSCKGGSEPCGCNNKPSQQASPARPMLVYALGQIGLDFGTEARRDSFSQQTGRNVSSNAEMVEYLSSDPASAGSLHWTLTIDETPVYAIAPTGPFAAATYDRMRDFLRAQITEGVERVSIPGTIGGMRRLLNGQVVPLIIPEHRGMYSWTTQSLVSAVLGEAPKAKDAMLEYTDRSVGIQQFLSRIYYEIRNLGVTAQERAMNYAATNAFQLQSVYGDAIKSGLKLDSIDVERSPICKPGSDCWDVKLSFFNPTKRFEQARRVYRYTIDVSDIVPVTVGTVRQWDVY